MSLSLPARAMKPAKSSATGPCRSPITTSSWRRSRKDREGKGDDDASLDGRRHRCGDRRAAERRALPAPPARRSTRAPSSRATCFSPSGATRGTDMTSLPRPWRRGLRPLSSRRSARRRSKGWARLPSCPTCLRPCAEPVGRAARRTGAQIVAITGSVGKTGTKEAMRLALSHLGPTHASVASYNNHWGVPLTLTRMPQASAFGVFEIGMNHSGEIAPLVRDGAAARCHHHHGRARSHRVFSIDLGHRGREGRNLLRASSPAGRR